jgi:hypothetical protein
VRQGKRRRKEEGLYVKEKFFQVRACTGYKAGGFVPRDIY